MVNGMSVLLLTNWFLIKFNFNKQFSCLSSSSLCLRSVLVLAKEDLTGCMSDWRMSSVVECHWMFVEWPPYRMRSICTQFYAYVQYIHTQTHVVRRWTTDFIWLNYVQVADHKLLKSYSRSLSMWYSKTLFLQLIC